MPHEILPFFFLRNPGTSPCNSLHSLRITTSNHFERKVMPRIYIESPGSSIAPQLLLHPSLSQPPNEVAKQDLFIPPRKAIDHGGSSRGDILQSLELAHPPHKVLPHPQRQRLLSGVPPLLLGEERLQRGPLPPSTASLLLLTPPSLFSSSNPL